MSNISWEAQQSQYDLGILEDELNYTQSLLNQKCEEIRNAGNNIALQNEIEKLQEKLVNSENNLLAKSSECEDLVHKHQGEIQEYKQRLDKANQYTSDNNRVETYKIQKEKKESDKKIRKLQRELQEAGDAKSSAEYSNQCLINQINQLNEEMHKIKTGHKNVIIRNDEITKSQSVKEKFTRTNDLILESENVLDNRTNDYEEELYLDIWSEDNQVYEINKFYGDSENMMNNYYDTWQNGFNESTSFLFE